MTSSSRNVDALLSDGMRATKSFREEHGLPLDNLNLADRFQPALDAYERITGFRETNATALHHHRISLFGPPCTVCGRVLRTAATTKCFECEADQQ